MLASNRWAGSRGNWWATHASRHTLKYASSLSGTLSSDSDNNGHVIAMVRTAKASTIAVVLGARICSAGG